MDLQELKYNFGHQYFFCNKVVTLSTTAVTKRLQRGGGGGRWWGVGVAGETVVTWVEY